MFTPKLYPCHCRVCGADFDHLSQFLSGPYDEKTGRIFMQCGKHTGEEVRAAYQKSIAGAR